MVVPWFPLALLLVRGLLVTMQFIAVPQALTRGSIRANEAWEEVRESEEGWSQRGSEWESMGSVGVARGKKRYITARRIKKHDTSSRPHATEGRTNSSSLSYDPRHHPFFTWLPDSHCSRLGMMLICMRVHTGPLIVLSRLNCWSAKHANKLFAWHVSLSPPFVPCCRKNTKNSTYTRWTWEIELSLFHMEFSALINVKSDSEHT